MFDERTILRTLKGPPIAILLCFFMSDCPRPTVGEKWIAERTGYTRKIAGRNLKKLADLQLLERDGHREGWRLTSEARQLPLPFAELGPGHVAVIEAETGERTFYPHQVDGERTFYPHPSNGRTPPPEARPGERTFYPHQLPTTTVNYKEVEAVAATATGERTFYAHHPQNPDLSTETLEILRSAGIGEPVRSQLASLHWCTPDYARAHLKAKADLALKIHRMRAGDPAPAPAAPRQHIPDDLKDIIKR